MSNPHFLKDSRTKNTYFQTLYTTQNFWVVGMGKEPES